MSSDDRVSVVAAVAATAAYLPAFGERERKAVLPNRSRSSRSTTHTFTFFSVSRWGEKDPWEPVRLGEKYGLYSTVESFERFPTLGHCPMDEGPQVREMPKSEPKSKSKSSLIRVHLIVVS